MTANLSSSNPPAQPLAGRKTGSIIGAFLYFINLYAYNYGIPMAEKAFNELEWQIKNDVSHLMFREGEFTELQNGLNRFYYIS